MNSYHLFRGEIATMNILRGQRLKLTDIISDNSEFQLGIAWTSLGGDIDVSCFGLDAHEKLSDDRYLTFFNQPTTPCGGVSLSTPVDDNTGFTVALQKLPSTICRLMITAAIDGVGTMSQLTSGYIRFLCKGNEVARFSFSGSDFSNERALMLLEIYRKDDIWRISAVGQGFNGGMDALVEYFGGEIANPTPTTLTPTSPETEIKSPAISEQKIQTAKVTLKKQGDSTQISLKKKDLSIIDVKMYWTKGADLDLHAFYKTKSGEFGQVYFGEKGKLDGKPFILLDKDAGVGGTAGKNEENLRIKNLNHFSSIIIAANIFRFLGFLHTNDNFAKYDGKVEIKTDTGDSVIVPLMSEEKGRWCIIAKIDNTADHPSVININKIQAEEPTEDAL